MISYMTTFKLCLTFEVKSTEHFFEVLSKIQLFGAPNICNTGHIVKLSAKAQEAMIQAKHQNPPTATKNAKVEKLIVQLIKILENWDKGTNVLAA